MRCQFWNSALWVPSETLVRVNQRQPQGIFVINRGSLLIYGDGPCSLKAYKSNNVRAYRDEHRNWVLEWTEPAHRETDRATMVLVAKGSPTEHMFVFEKAPHSPEVMPASEHTAPKISNAVRIAVKHLVKNLKPSKP